MFSVAVLKINTNRIIIIFFKQINKTFRKKRKVIIFNQFLIIIWMYGVQNFALIQKEILPWIKLNYR